MRTKQHRNIYLGENIRDNDEDQGFDNRWVLAFVAVVVVFFLYNNRATKDSVHFKDEQLALEEQEQWQQHSKIKQMMGILDVMRAEMTETDKKYTENKQAMDKVFGSKNKASAASFDDELSSFEEEQSLDTAFIMKEELEKQRNQLTELDKELTEKKGKMAQEYQHLLSVVKQESEAYKSTYGVDVMS